MRPDLKAMIERGATGLRDYTADWEVESRGETTPDPMMHSRQLASAVLRAALPGLFTEPPECWLAPWEMTERMWIGSLSEESRFMQEANYAAMRDAHLVALANPIPDAEQS